MVSAQPAIVDCIGYEKQLAVNQYWSYLADLEEDHSCAGWCQPSQPLWTFKVVKDSCTALVADILHQNVQWCMLQVVVYTALAFALCSITLIMVGPIMRNIG